MWITCSWREGWLLEGVAGRGSGQVGSAVRRVRQRQQQELLVGAKGRRRKGGYGGGLGGTCVAVNFIES